MKKQSTKKTRAVRKTAAIEPIWDRQTLTREVRKPEEGGGRCPQIVYRAENSYSKVEVVRYKNSRGMVLIRVAGQVEGYPETAAFLPQQALMVAQAMIAAAAEAMAPRKAALLTDDDGDECNARLGAGIDNVILEKVRQHMAREIERAGGMEVFFIGKTDAEGVVVSARVEAVGNKHVVPAPFARMRAGDVCLHNHPTGGLEPSNSDIECAATVGQNGCGFWIVNNQVDLMRIVTWPELVTARDKSLLVAAEPDPGKRSKRGTRRVKVIPARVRM